MSDSLYQAPSIVADFLASVPSLRGNIPRPTEQGSPRLVPSGWRLLGTHRNCVSETHGQDKLQLPEASAVIPPPGVAPAKGRREGALQPRVAGFPALSLGGCLGALNNTED